MRVEYLLALQDAEPPTDRCRPVLFALSSRRPAPAAGGRCGAAPPRVRLVRAAEPAAAAAGPAERRRGPGPHPRRSRHRRGAQSVPVSWPPASASPATDLTLIATAVSEIARNIVRFAGDGEIVIELLEEPATRRPGGGPRHRAGHRGRRAGAGRRLQHVQRAGTGTAGCAPADGRVRGRIELGRGTTVTMTKWRQEG